MIRNTFEPEVLLRLDGWYWIDDACNLIGPYETRAEAIYAGRTDDDVYFWDQYET